MSSSPFSNRQPLHRAIHSVEPHTRRVELRTSCVSLSTNIRVGEIARIKEGDEGERAVMSRDGEA